MEKRERERERKEEEEKKVIFTIPSAQPPQIKAKWGVASIRGG